MRYAISIDFKAYLNVVNIPKHRMALSRLRTSSHHLGIETGRWHKPISIPYNDRKYIACDKLDDVSTILLLNVHYSMI